MIPHGYNHICGPGGVDGTSKWFANMGFRPVRMLAWVSGRLELIAGVGLLLGFAAALWSTSVVGIATVDGVAVHWRNGFFVFQDGYEYFFMLGIASMTLAVLGPGRWALDDLPGISWSGGRLGLVVLMAGCVGAAALLAMSWRPARPDGHLGAGAS